MPVKFKRAEIRDAGHVLLLSKSSVDRLLTSAEKKRLNRFIRSWLFFIKQP